jgi:hypothetical protein
VASEVSRGAVISRPLDVYMAVECFMLKVYSYQSRFRWFIFFLPITKAVYV